MTVTNRDLEKIYSISFDLMMSDGEYNVGEEKQNEERILGADEIMKMIVNAEAKSGNCTEHEEEVMKAFWLGRACEIYKSLPKNDGRLVMRPSDFWKYETQGTTTKAVKRKPGRPKKRVEK